MSIIIIIIIISMYLIKSRYWLHWLILIHVVFLSL